MSIIRDGSGFSATPSPLVKRDRVPLILILLTATVLLQPTNWYPLFRDPNVLSRVTLSSSLYYRGDVNIAPEVSILPQEDIVTVGDKVYSNKPPGSSLWMLLFTLLIDRLTPDPLRPMQLMVFGRIPALTIPWILFCWWLGKRLSERTSPAAAWGAVLLLNFATNAGTYATAYYGHNLAAICLGISLLVAVRGTGGAFFAGLMAGFAVMFEPNVLPLVVLNCGLAFFSGQKDKIERLICYMAGLVPAGAILAFYNYLTTGEFWTFVFKYDTQPLKYADGRAVTQYGFGLPTLKSVTGVWISAARGLLYFSPWIALLFPLAFRAIKGLFQKNSQDTAKIVGICGLATLLFPFWVSCYSVWFGGYSLGVRFLIPMMPYVVILTAEFIHDGKSSPNRIERLKSALFWGLAGASVVIHTVNLLVFPLNQFSGGLWSNFGIDHGLTLIGRGMRIPLWWDLIESGAFWAIPLFVLPMILAWMVYGLWRFAGTSRSKFGGFALTFAGVILFCALYTSAAFALSSITADNMNDKDLRPKAVTVYLGSKESYMESFKHRVLAKDYYEPTKKRKVQLLTLDYSGPSQK